MYSISRMEQSAFSNEIESRILSLKIFMDNRELLVSSSSFTNEGSKSVSISDSWRFFDRSRNIVVGVTELIGEKLNHVRRFTNSVIDNSVPSRSRHSLLGSCCNQKELIDISVSNWLINDCSRHRILESSNVSSKKSSVNSFANIQVPKRKIKML